VKRQGCSRRGEGSSKSQTPNGLLSPALSSGGGEGEDHVGSWLQNMDEAANEDAAPTELGDRRRDVGSYKDGAPTELFNAGAMPSGEEEDAIETLGGTDEVACGRGVASGLED
jgi:hypothetical protein